MSNNGRQRNTGTNPLGSQWCYTVNNPGDDDVLRLRALHTSQNNRVLYHAFQAEVGESGTPHLQGYIAFTHKKKRSTVANLVSRRAHLERTLGTPTQASDYCTDEQKRDPEKMDVVHVYGNLADVPNLALEANAPGARNDLSDCKRRLDEGATVWELADEHWGSVVRYHKAFAAYKHARTEPRDFKTLNFLFYGAPRTGKSRAAFNFDRCFVVPASNGQQWMDGYDPERHDTVIFDDFHASVPAHVLLRLLDEYPLQFPTKGGFVEFRPKAIVMTSNYPPSEWYDWNKVKADYTALWERFFCVWEYFKPETAADKEFCEENDIHVMLRCHKGDWHPQDDELIPCLRAMAEGPPCFGLKKDEIPVTQEIETMREYCRSLLARSPPDAPESEPEPEPAPWQEDEIEEVSDDSHSVESISSSD